MATVPSLVDSQSAPDYPLQGCVISCTGFEAKPREHLRGLVVQAGAVWQRHLRRHDDLTSGQLAATHLVVNSSGGPESEKYRSAKKWGIHIVDVWWLRDSLTQLERQDEALYRVDLTASEMQSRRRTGNSNSNSNNNSDSERVAALREGDCQAMVRSATFQDESRLHQERGPHRQEGEVNHVEVSLSSSVLSLARDDSFGHVKPLRLNSASPHVDNDRESKQQPMDDIHTRILPMHTRSPARITTSTEETHEFSRASHNTQMLYKKFENSSCVEVRERWSINNISDAFGRVSMGEIHAAELSHRSLIEQATKTIEAQEKCLMPVLDKHLHNTNTVVKPTITSNTSACQEVSQLWQTKKRSRHDFESKSESHQKYVDLVTTKREDFPAMPSLLSAIECNADTDKAQFYDLNSSSTRVQQPRKSSPQSIPSFIYLSPRKADDFLDSLCVWLVGLDSASHRRAVGIVRAGTGTRYNGYREVLTHVVAPSYRAYREALAAQRVSSAYTSCHVVSLAWLEACMLKRSIVDESPFLLTVEKVTVEEQKQPILTSGITSVQLLSPQPVPFSSTFTKVFDTKPIREGISRTDSFAHRAIGAIDQRKSKYRASNPASKDPSPLFNSEKSLISHFECCSFCLLNIPWTVSIELVSLIRDAGGKILKESELISLQDTRHFYAVTEYYTDSLLDEPFASAHQVTPFWIRISCHYKQRVQIQFSVLYRPLPRLNALRPLAQFQSICVTFSGFRVASHENDTNSIVNEQTLLSQLLTAVGATVCNELGSKTTVLIANVPNNQSEKFKAATIRGIPVVVKRWACDCLLKQTLLNTDEYVWSRHSVKLETELKDNVAEEIDEDTALMKLFEDDTEMLTIEDGECNLFNETKPIFRHSLVNDGTSRSDIELFEHKSEIGVSFCIERNNILAPSQNGAYVQSVDMPVQPGACSKKRKQRSSLEHNSKDSFSQKHQKGQMESAISVDNFAFAPEKALTLISPEVLQTNEHQGSAVLASSVERHFSPKISKTKKVAAPKKQKVVPLKIDSRKAQQAAQKALHKRILSEPPQAWAQFSHSLETRSKQNEVKKNISSDATAAIVVGAEHDAKSSVHHTHTIFADEKPPNFASTLPLKLLKADSSSSKHASEISLFANKYPDQKKPNTRAISSSIDDSAPPNNVKITSSTRVSKRRKTRDGVGGEGMLYVLSFPIKPGRKEDEEFWVNVLRLGNAKKHNTEDDWKHCTHVVVHEVKRSERVMCAIAAGKPLVSIQWLRDSLEQGHWLDTAAYLLLTSASDKIEEYLVVAAKRWKDERPFAGQKFLLKCGPDTEKLLRHVLAAGDGEVVRLARQMDETNGHIIYDEKVQFTRVPSSNIPVYKFSFIFDWIAKDTSKPGTKPFTKVDYVHVHK